MTSALDMALDDLIKANKQGAGRGRGSGRGGSGVLRRGSYDDSFNGSFAGPIRRAGNMSNFRSSPYSSTKSAQKGSDGFWEHDLFEEGTTVSGPSDRSGMGIETGTKLFISNLDYGVSNEDIKELFSEIGDLKRSFVHFDRSGRSKGTAEVLYSRRADAVQAIKRYNGVQLDGKHMKIELIGTNLSIPMQNTSLGNVNGNTTVRVARGGGTSFEAQTRETSRRGGRGRGRGGCVFKTASDLDTELDNYHAEAMQT